MILLAEHDEPLLAAKKKRQVAASESLTSTPKNRVWGFENTPSGRPSVESQLSWENATGSVQYTYQIASGRAEWLSRDPIAENGGLNLYGYVDNDPINLTDRLGLFGLPTSLTLVNTIVTSQFNFPIHAYDAQPIIDQMTYNTEHTFDLYHMFINMHGNGGPLDPYGRHNLHNPDRFHVKGRCSGDNWLDDDQFGNYLAGYDAHTAFGLAGIPAIRYAALQISKDDVANGVHPTVDHQQTDLNNGINDSVQRTLDQIDF